MKLVIFISTVILTTPVFEGRTKFRDLPSPEKSAQGFTIKPLIKAERVLYEATSNCLFNASVGANKLEQHNQIINDVNKCVGVKFEIRF